MDARLNIHFKRQKDGSTLATAVMIVAGSNDPRFFRMRLAKDVDPWVAYSDVANQAVGHLKKIQEVRTDKEKPAGARKAAAGRLIQLRGILPTS